MDELIAFFRLEELFGLINGLVHISPDLADHLVIPGDPCQEVERPVTGHGIYVLPGKGDFGKFVALFPDLHEDVLYDLFCINGGMAELPGEGK